MIYKEQLETLLSQQEFSKLDVEAKNILKEFISFTLEKCVLQYSFSDFRKLKKGVVRRGVPKKYVTPEQKKEAIKRNLKTYSQNKKNLLKNKSDISKIKNTSDFA